MRLLLGNEWIVEFNRVTRKNNELLFFWENGYGEYGCWHTHQCKDVTEAIELILQINRDGFFPPVTEVIK